MGIVRQAQHHMVSDYSRMQNMLLDERKGIAGRVGIYEVGVLTQLATGDSTVLAAALGWPFAAVEKAKGAWFDAQFDENDNKEFTLDESVGIIRAEGFTSSEALRYHKSTEKLVRAECHGSL